MWVKYDVSAGRCFDVKGSYLLLLYWLCLFFKWSMLWGCVCHLSASTVRWSYSCHTLVERKLCVEDARPLAYGFEAIFHYHSVFVYLVWNTVVTVSTTCRNFKKHCTYPTRCMYMFSRDSKDKWWHFLKTGLIDWRLWWVYICVLYDVVGGGLMKIISTSCSLKILSNNCNTWLCMSLGKHVSIRFIHFLRINSENLFVKT